MKYFILTILMTCLAFGGFAQDKLAKTVKKADAYYKSMKYHKAIPLYYKAIRTKEKHTLALRTKLAYCYRMLNQMDKAEELYFDIVSEKKARSITFYYYGEALMANGKYDEAKEWFLKYDAYNPKDKRGITMAGACEKAKTLPPFFPNVTLSRMVFNTPGDDYAPMYYGDGLLFVSDNIEESKTKMEYEWSGRSYSSIYYEQTDTARAYMEPLPFSKKINKRNKNSGPLSISGNQNFLYFSRNNEIPNKSGNKFTMAIYVAEKGIGGWKKPKVLPICNVNFNFMHPAASFTGDTLYFVSNVPGGFGETDIYMTYRKEIKKTNKRGKIEIIEKWIVPINLGDGINTPEREAFPFFANDGSLYFSSKGHAGFGGFDLFVSTMNRAFIYEKSINLGANINSPKDDMSIIFSGDKRTGYFASNRLSGMDDDIFAFRRGSKQITIDGEVMNQLSKDYLSNAKISLSSYNDNYMAFSDDQGNFQFKVKPGKEYRLSITRRGYAPYEYPIDATKLEDGEVLPFLIQLRQLEFIPYAHIDHEQSKEEVEPDLSMYKPQAEVINEEIDPYKYLPPSIPARDLVAKQVKKIVNQKQAYYRNEMKSMPIPEKGKAEVLPEVMPEKSNEESKIISSESIIMEESIPESKKPVKRKKENNVAEYQQVIMEEATINKGKNKLSTTQQLSEIDANQKFMDIGVINEYNKPIGSVAVYLMDEKRHLLEIRYTDDNGYIVLALEVKKKYILKLERDGFVTKTMMLCIDKEENSNRLGKKILMKPEQIATNMMIFNQIMFSKGGYDLNESAKVELERVANTMKENPLMTIELTGFTDALGDANYNKELSKKRAMAVAEYLISKGIEPTKIILKNKGATDLVNGCKEGISCSEKLHQENRRVKIVVVNNQL